MVMGEEKEILGEPSDARIPLDHITVFQRGIESIPVVATV